MTPKTFTEEALALLKMYEEDDHKPHQKHALAAFRASAAADELGREITLGQKDASHAEKARDLHKAAYDAHVGAAKSLVKAGQHSTAQQHVDLAVKHGKAAAQFHAKHQHHMVDQPRPKAAGERSKLYGLPIAESRALMGLERYPTLAECRSSKIK